MKKLSLLLLLLISVSASAQDSELSIDTTGPWQFEGQAQLTFSQVALSNWQGGGENTISGISFLNLAGGYTEGRHSWDNVFKAGYGIIKQGKGDNIPFRKSDDVLKFFSKYGYELVNNWYATGLADFQTIFTPGYNYVQDSAGNIERAEKTAAFFAPAYLLTSAGLEYKPSEAFFAMLAPVSVKTTFLMDDSMAAIGAYGVDTGKNIRNEFGAVFKSVINAPIMENITFLSDLGLFANYENIEAIDVNWSGQLVFNINKFFITKIGADLIYDEDIIIEREDGTTGPALQVKEVFSLGVQYKF